LKYSGSSSDITNANNKIGVIIANLGTPERPVCPSLRKYLSEFLTDPRVIELPNLLRQFLVKGIIINVRSHKSAAAYREVWTDEGSPLMIHTSQLAEKLNNHLDDQCEVVFGMRYGEPSIDNALSQLHDKGIRKVIIIPMYPQYSGSTSGSIMDAVGSSLKKRRWVPELHFINSYHTNPHYIDALASSVEQHWDSHGKAKKLVISFHGIPQRYVSNGDPYQHHCEETTKLLANKLNLKEDQYLLVYQSRVGREPWLQPYCDETMKSLPNNGIDSVDVICPGFSADCLETIEEIGEENREYFMEAGGEKYEYISALNVTESHIQVLASLVQENLSGWGMPDATVGEQTQQYYRQLQEQKADNA